MLGMTCGNVDGGDMGSKRNIITIAALLLAVLLAIAACAPSANAPSSDAPAADAPAADTPAAATDAPSPYAASWAGREGYTLKRVVILSRHNIRSPLSTGGSMLALATPHTWHEWSSNPSELSVKGAVLETAMGEFFRVWLESQGLFPQNYQPAEGAVRIYANSLQRCIATANCFSSGLLPVAGIEVETQGTYDEMNPTFHPRFTFAGDDYARDVLEQVAERGDGDDVAHAAAGLEDEYALLQDVLDYEESDGFASGELAPLAVDDTEFVVELGAEPALKGSLKTATSLADALVLQYYEEPDAAKAAFGHELTPEQWASIGSIKDDYYTELLFTAPLIARNVAHPLLAELDAELGNDTRELAFLCGHDSNIASVLGALGAVDYELADTIEPKTPIGSKLIFEVWESASGEEFASIRLAYATTDQLRELQLLDMGNPPASATIELEGLAANEDGLYVLSDLRQRFAEAIGAYDEMLAEYAEAEELPAAA